MSSPSLQTSPDTTLSHSQPITGSQKEELSSSLPTCPPQEAVESYEVSCQLSFLLTRQTRVLSCISQDITSSPVISFVAFLMA